MRPFKPNPLTLFMVIALLGVIVVVLILPDVDLPDTAFQRNSSLQVLRSLSHQVPHASAAALSSPLAFQFGVGSIPLRRVQGTTGRSCDRLSFQREPLRC